MRHYYSKSRSSDKVMIVTSEAEAEHVMQQIGKDAAWSYEVGAIALIDADHVGETIHGIPVVARMRMSLMWPDRVQWTLYYCIAHI